MLLVLTAACRQELPRPATDRVAVTLSAADSPYQAEVKILTEKATGCRGRPLSAGAFFEVSSVSDAGIESRDNWYLGNVQALWLYEIATGTRYLVVKI
jgi:hypothetical protein